LKKEAKITPIDISCDFQQGNCNEYDLFASAYGRRPKIS